MYHHTENEAASLKHSKLRAWIEKIRCLKVNVKMSKAPNYLERYRNRYPYQTPAISGQLFLSCMLLLFRFCDLDLGPMTLKLIVA